MASQQFIGLTIAVTLNTPPNTVVEGLVAGIDAETSTLALQNGEDAA